MPHVNEKIDFTVEVFLVFKDRVLIRKHDKYDIVTGVGGHIESDEDPIQATIREVKEETGLDIKLDESLNIANSNGDLTPPYGMNRHRISDTHEHIGLYYCGVVTSDKVIQQESEKSDDIKWLTREELLKFEGISENIRIYALKALEMVSKQV